MAKPSSVKKVAKVAKVARTGGGRTKRGQTSWFFPTLLICLSILGVFLVAFSRAQRQPDLSRPRIGDHWHSAIGFNVCGAFAPNVPDNNQDPLGIHTHGDGVVHTHPFSSQSAGTRATLQIFLDTLDIRVTDNELRLPGGDTKKNGERCETGPASIRVKVWDTRAPTDNGRIVAGDPGDIRLGDNQLITVAFLPEGTDIPRPPSEGQLDRLTDLGPTPSTTVAGAETTTAPGATTAPEATTTAPPTTTATTAAPPANP